jgi:DNA-binding beta-propeller fold protein YncE
MRWLKLFACCALLFAGTEPTPLELVGKVPLPALQGRFDHLAADIFQGRLFVAAAGNDSVEVLDVRNNSALDSISGLPDPQGVAYVKSSNRLFIACGGDGSLRTYDAATLKPTGNLRLGTDAGNIRVDDLRNLVYVGYGNGAIAVLDNFGKKLAEIPLKARPESFQLAERQPRLYVNLPDAHSIAVVDTESKKIIAEWPIQEGYENFPMALDEANKRLFVACRRPARLLVLDMDSGLVLLRLPTVTDADDLFYDAIHSRIYVMGGGGHVATYAQETADHYSALEETSTAIGARTGLFVPEWNRLFVAVGKLGRRPAEIQIYVPK